MVISIYSKEIYEIIFNSYLWILYKTVRILGKEKKSLIWKSYCEKNTKVKKKTTANIINSERLNAFPVILGKRKISITSI